MPPAAAYAMAELLDPRCSWSPFAKRSSPPPDQKQRFDDSLAKVEAACGTASVAFARLVEIYNRRVKEPENRRGWLELEAFAEERKDPEALRAFAAHRKALDELTAAMNAINAINRAVRLAVKPLSEKHRARLARNDRIVGEMLVELGRGRSSNTATQIIGERFGLTDRSVKKLWAAAREAEMQGEPSSWRPLAATLTAIGEPAGMMPFPDFAKPLVK